eukprot:TRINITY_DN26874_c0_g1_i1.p1 TRINITY_DN26874_c0_g1~~TRINITY_DN26874_c0_g1_i1.p1  ORF type:complete len:370 (+),score=80.94 TRINITY_DN26874_c0_g1_i1:61-1110(+)
MPRRQYGREAPVGSAPGVWAPPAAPRGPPSPAASSACGSAGPRAAGAAGKRTQRQAPPIVCGSWNAPPPPIDPPTPSLANRGQGSPARSQCDPTQPTTHPENQRRGRMRVGSFGNNTSASTLPGCKEMGTPPPPGEGDLALSKKGRGTAREPHQTFSVTRQGYPAAATARAAEREWVTPPPHTSPPREQVSPGGRKSREGLARVRGQPPAASGAVPCGREQAVFARKAAVERTVTPDRPQGRRTNVASAVAARESLVLSAPKEQQSHRPPCCFSARQRLHGQWPGAPTPDNPHGAAPRYADPEARAARPTGRRCSRQHPPAALAHSGGPPAAPAAPDNSAPGAAPAPAD